MTAHATLRKTTGRTLAAGGFTSGLATAMVATLLAATADVAAPIRSGDEAGPGYADTGNLVDVVCFNIPRQWNVALEGPLPGCHRTVR